MKRSLMILTLLTATTLVRGGWNDCDGRDSSVTGAGKAGNPVDSIKEELQDFRAPSSPAFVLMAVEPGTIERPTSPRAVAASIVTAVSQGGALEFAPYWLASHPRLTYDDYYGADIGRTILQSFAVSFASLPRSADGDSLGTRAGIGMRFLLFPGTPPDSLKQYHDALVALQKEVAGQRDDSELDARTNARMKSLALAIQRQDKTRRGFKMEAATALTMNFKEDDFGRGQFDRWGAWLTAAYVAEEPSLDVLGVVRIIQNYKADGTQTLFDAGGALAWNLDDLSVSLGYIHRSQLRLDGAVDSAGITKGLYYLKQSYRLAGQIEYRYAKDFIFELSFGRNYATGDRGERTLIAQVGIRLGLGLLPLYQKDSGGM